MRNPYSSVLPKDIHFLDVFTYTLSLLSFINKFGIFHVSHVILQFSLLTLFLSNFRVYVLFVK